MVKLRFLATLFLVSSVIHPFPMRDFKGNPSHAALPGRRLRVHMELGEDPVRTADLN